MTQELGSGFDLECLRAQRAADRWKQLFIGLNLVSNRPVYGYQCALELETSERRCKAQPWIYECRSRIEIANKAKAGLIYYIKALVGPGLRNGME